MPDVTHDLNKDPDEYDPFQVINDMEMFDPPPLLSEKMVEIAAKEKRSVGDIALAYCRNLLSGEVTAMNFDGQVSFMPTDQMTESQKAHMMPPEDGMLVVLHSAMLVEDRLDEITKRVESGDTFPEDYGLTQCPECGKYGYDDDEDYDEESLIS